MCEFMAQDIVQFLLHRIFYISEPLKYNSRMNDAHEHRSRDAAAADQFDPAAAASGCGMRAGISILLMGEAA